MIILWTMFEHGEIYKTESFKNIPIGAYMFTTKGIYLGRRRYNLIIRHSCSGCNWNYVMPENYKPYIIETNWNDLLN